MNHSAWKGSKCKSKSPKTTRLSQSAVSFCSDNRCADWGGMGGKQSFCMKILFWKEQKRMGSSKKTNEQDSSSKHKSLLQNLLCVLCLVLEGGKEDGIVKKPTEEKNKTPVRNTKCGRTCGIETQNAVERLV